MTINNTVKMDENNRLDIANQVSNRLKAYSNTLKELDCSVMSVNYDIGVSSSLSRINVLIYDNKRLYQSEKENLQKLENILPRAFEYKGVNIPITLSYGRVCK